MIAAVSEEDRMFMLLRAMYMDAGEIEKRDSLLSCSVCFPTCSYAHLTVHVFENKNVCCVCDGGCGGWGMVYTFCWMRLSSVQGICSSRHHD